MVVTSNIVHFACNNEKYCITLQSFMRKVIGIGETVFDIIFRDNQPVSAVPGGSTFNAMISLGRTLGRKGTECLMISETGDDHIGQIIVDFMKQNNVSPKFVTINENTKSHI